MYRSFILSEFRYMYVSITFTVSDIFDFMKQYDLSYPYEYLQDWVDYYTFKTNKLAFGGE